MNRNQIELKEGESEVHVLDQFKLDGQVALVTGCRRGIGKAMALALAEAGAGIIGVSATMEKGGSQIEEEVRALDRNFAAYRCDLGDRRELYAFIERVKADFPRIDILVNNAGKILRSPAIEHSDAYWDTTIEVNLSAQFILAREIGKSMIERGKGKIIFMASLLTFQGGITVPGYAASKGGVGQLTKAFANEWAAKGVNVNAIAPGYICTDNTRALRRDSKRSAAILSRIPSGRWGQPEDFKGAVLFLASHASDYVNGSIVVVDGGWLGG